MIFVFIAYFNQWNQCFLSGSKGLLYLGGSCISVMSKIKNILTLLDEKTSTSDRNKYTLGMTRVFNPIKKILSSLSVVYQTVRLRKRFYSVLFYSELKQKNTTLRERHANWRSSEEKSLEGNQQLTLGGELVRGAELSCCRSCCDVWLGVDGGVKLAVKSSSTPWDDCRSAAGRAAGGQVPTQQTPANYRTIKAKTIKNIWIRELDI